MAKSTKNPVSDEPLYKKLTFEQIISLLTEAAGSGPRGGRKKVRGGGSSVRWYSYRHFNVFPNQYGYARTYNHAELMAECLRLGLNFTETRAPSPSGYGVFQGVVVLFPADVRTTVTITPSMREAIDFLESCCGQRGEAFRYSKFHMKSKGYVLFKFRDLKEGDRTKHVGLGVLLDRFDEHKQGDGWQGIKITYKWSFTKGIRQYTTAARYEPENILPGVVMRRGLAGVPEVADPDLCYVARYFLEIRIAQGSEQ